jgi:hypothetical protein
VCSNFKVAGDMMATWRRRHHRLSVSSLNYKKVFNFASSLLLLLTDAKANKIELNLFLYIYTKARISLYICRPWTWTVIVLHSTNGEQQRSRICIALLHTLENPASPRDSFPAKAGSIYRQYYTSMRQNAFSCQLALDQKPIRRLM